MLKKQPKSQLEKIEEDYQAALYERDQAAQEQRHYETQVVLYLILWTVATFSQSTFMVIIGAVGAVVCTILSILRLREKRRFERELNRSAKEYQDIQEHPFLGGHTP